MKILDFFKKKDVEQTKMSDMILIESTNRVYLKRLALNICINYIARTISGSEFRIYDNKKVIKNNTLHYKLNVRPNTDSSAADFWHKIVTKLLHDNEVLVIQTDTDDLVVADDFERNELGLYDDTFSDVVVKNYRFQRTFQMSEVFYLNYNNEKLNTFVDDLYKDYGQLFGQTLDNNMRKNQLRGFFKYADGGNLDKETFEKQKAQVERLTKIFEKSSVAYAPLTEGIEFNDLTPSSTQKDESVDDLIKIKRDLIDDVAKMLGIPPNLVNGDVADLEATVESYVTFCINPLIKKLSDELNAKFFTVPEYNKGKRIKIIGVNKRDPLKYADAADKLISSSLFTPDGMRELFGEEPSGRPGMDEYYITKNYQTANSGGGDK